VHSGNNFVYSVFPPLTTLWQILIVSRAQVDLVNSYGNTALAIAIDCNNRKCAELLLHAGAKLSNVKVLIEDWMNDIVTKRNNLKAAFTVLYGILRRRIDVPFLFNPISKNVSPVVNIICSMLTDTRYHASWNICDTYGKKTKY
jgi:ankyrin repeat protein